MCESAPGDLSRVWDGPWEAAALWADALVTWDMVHDPTGWQDDAGMDLPASTASLVQAVLMAVLMSTARAEGLDQEDGSGISATGLHVLLDACPEAAPAPYWASIRQAAEEVPARTPLAGPLAALVESWDVVRTAAAVRTRARLMRLTHRVVAHHLTTAPLPHQTPLQAALGGGGAWRPTVGSRTAACLAIYQGHAATP